MGIEYNPPEPDNTDCDIEEGHDWKVTGRAPDGTEFVKCKRCGETDEQ